MVNSSKVLTVSYGTFSCTLEGFDDSFETMKAIAEYFRDLAADDRYFGAEPPTPDAEMLARIAEREVARHVEAHRDGDSIVLRTALPAAATTAAEITAPAEETQEQAQAVETDAPDTVEDASGESESERLEREEMDALEEQKRAEVRARRQARREQAEREERDAAEQAEREKAEREAAEKAEREAAELAEREAAEQAARAAAEAAEREAAEHVKRAAEQAAEEAKRAAAEDDSVAAKLARIRAVVGQPEAVATPDYSEDEHADDLMQGRADDTDLEDLLDEGTSEPAPAVPEAAPEQEAAKSPIRARVIKMKREEFEAALASGDIEEQPDDEDEAQSLDTPIDTSLSPVEEDELARELAAVEAELAGEAQPAPAPQAPAPRAATELPAKPDQELDRLMTQAGDELEEPEGKQRRNALGHLRAAVAAARADKDAGPRQDPVDETADYRDDLQSTVQPRRPVRRLTADEAAPQAASARPPLKLVAEQRVDQPPVAAAPAAAPVAAPVRPRRVRAGDPAPAAASAAAEAGTEDGSFLEFAEEMGATELPDLLEAAAAYMAFVEGREQFSRPQLMTKVRMVQDESFSREDGLRSFGQLLRQGKIEKVSGGRFTVSDRISFKPDARAVG